MALNIKIAIILTLQYTLFSHNYLVCETNNEAFVHEVNLVPKLENLLKTKKI